MVLNPAESSSHRFSNLQVAFLTALLCLTLLPTLAGAQNVSLGQSEYYFRNNHARPAFQPADVDGDGLMELLISYPSDTTVLYIGGLYWCKPGYSDTQFKIMNYESNAFSNFTAADFNHNGKMDLIAVRLEGHIYLINDVTSITDPNRTVPKFISIGDGSNWPPSAPPVLADFNKDGWLDFVSTKPFAWYENRKDPNTSFTQHLIPTTLNHVYKPLAADLDQDGKPDLVVSAMGSPGITIYWNNGGGNFSEARMPATSWNYDFGCADFDRDGKPDLVVTSDLGTFWYQNKGSRNFERHQLSSDHLYRFTICDLDLDGNLDLAGMDQVFWGAGSSDYNLVPAYMKRSGGNTPQSLVYHTLALNPTYPIYDIKISNLIQNNRWQFLIGEARFDALKTGGVYSYTEFNIFDTVVSRLGVPSAHWKAYP